MTAPLRSDAPREDRSRIDQEIARVEREHLVSTGRPALHVGPCRRDDLHQQLIALHVRKRAITEGTR